MNSENLNYTVINHTARIKFDLSMNEYAVADLIYHLSGHPDSAYSGWCYASKNTMEDMLGIAKRNILKIIERLTEKKLIEKHPITKHLKTTKRWYNNVIMKTGDESSPAVTKDHQAGDETSPKVVTKDHRYYTRIYNKDIYNTVNGVVKGGIDENARAGGESHTGVGPTVEENKSLLRGLPDLDIEVGEKEYLVGEMLAVLKDKKSAVYYKLVASKIQPNFILEKLAEVQKDGPVENAGALFTYKIEQHILTRRMSTTPAPIMAGG